MHAHSHAHNTLTTVLFLTAIRTNQGMACEEHAPEMERYSGRDAAVSTVPLVSVRQPLTLTLSHAHTSQEGYEVVRDAELPRGTAAQVVAGGKSRRDLFFPNDQMRIPPGTPGWLLIGGVLGPLHQQPVIRWQGVSTGWPYLIRQLRLFLEPTAAGPTQEAVDRAATILALVQKLLLYSSRAATALRRDNPDLLALLFFIVETAPLSSPGLQVRKLVTRALRCIARFVDSFPDQVWAHLR
jgi:hypothetical protein